MRAEVHWLLASVLTACAPDVVIGLERQLSVTTASVLDDGRVREAGIRALADGTTEGWLGTSDVEGSLPSFTRPGVLSVAGSTRAAEGWVLVGTRALSDGRTAAWVGAFDERDGEQWATTLETAGASLEGVAIAATFDDDFFVAGLEISGGARDGWVALLDPRGGVKWRFRFAVDFQQQARGVLPLTVAAVAPPPSQSRRHLWLGGTRDGLAYALQLTLDGELWDSEPFGPGAVVGFVHFDPNLALCLRSSEGARFAWTQGAGVSGAAITADELAATIDPVTCLRSGELVVAVGANRASGAATSVSIDRRSRAAVGPALTRNGRPVVIRGAVLTREGAAMPLGHTVEPVRRWREPLR